MGDVLDSLRGRINKLFSVHVRAPSGKIEADDPPSSISNRTEVSKSNTARSSGIVAWFAEVRSYFTDLSCGFRRSKESGSIPDARRRLPVSQALLAIQGEKNEPQQQLHGAVLTGRYDLGRHIKLALAGGGDRKSAFERITGSFNRMRRCGASLEEVQAVGEFKIDDDEALEFLEGLARSESAGDASTRGVDLSKVVLTGTVDITDLRSHEQTLSRLQRAARLGVRMDKIKFTGSISTLDSARTLSQALSPAIGDKAQGPNLNGVRLLVEIPTAEVNPPMLQDVKNLVSMGPQVIALSFKGDMKIGAEDLQLHAQNLRSILDLAVANRSVTLDKLSVKARYDALANDTQMLTLLKSAGDRRASVVKEGPPDGISKQGL